jgi:putative flavoprotein involved in K+ transport
MVLIALSMYASRPMYVPASGQADPQRGLAPDTWSMTSERYARSFRVPILESVNVSSVDMTSEGDYVVGTDCGSWRADNVVVALRMFQRLCAPGWSVDIPIDVLQIHSSHYRSSNQVCSGAVLVIGSLQ